MNKIKKFFKSAPKFFKFITNYFHSRSISTQLILTIFLIFTSFFLLQTMLNSQFFKTFFNQQEFNDIHADLLEYVKDMDDETGDEYYDEIYAFTSERNAYSVIVSGSSRILQSSYTEYSIVVEDTLTNELYTVLVPNNDYVFSIQEELELSIYEYYDYFYSPATLNTSSGSTIFDGKIDCTDIICISLTGEVVEINKPNHLNYLFHNNSLVTDEIYKLSNNIIDIQTFNGEEGDWYISNDGPTDSIVFIYRLPSWNYIVTVIPLSDTDDIINIVAAYNSYVYLTAIVVIFLWSFRLSSIISKPIQNIELVTKEIASLNFSVEAKEFNNRENASLSSSINLISRNLKETLESLNKKNDELTNLYNDQSKQVSLKKQLVSSISHELKTPLMIMQITIQGILDGVIEEDNQEKELLNVVDEINKSSIMIQDLLQIYRLDDIDSKLELSEFNLSNIVTFFLADFENVIKSLNFELDLNIGENIVVEADMKLIKRVISNFITNALKYSPEGQKIYVEVSEDKNRAYFELVNYGAKIDKADLENIWIPFFRTNKSEPQKLETKGSGIGLYLVSEILKAHECTFGIENVKKGVKAYFYINKKVEY